MVVIGFFVDDSSSQSGQQTFIKVPVQVRHLIGRDRERAMEQVSERLLNSDSAEFGHIFTYTAPATNTDVFCAFVNAKNKYDIFIGERVFAKMKGTNDWLSKDDLLAGSSAELRESADVFDIYCRAALDGFGIVFRQ